MYIHIRVRPTVKKAARARAYNRSGCIARCAGLVWVTWLVTGQPSSLASVPAVRSTLANLPRGKPSASNFFLLPPPPRRLHPLLLSFLFAREPLPRGRGFSRTSRDVASIRAGCDCVLLGFWGVRFRTNFVIWVFFFTCIFLDKIFAFVTFWLRRIVNESIATKNCTKLFSYRYFTESAL